MKNIALRYGMYGVAVMFILCLATFLIFQDNPQWDLQEILGYATIILSLSFVYFGIRRWRDSYNGGKITFWKGIGIGTVISLFPSIAFGLFSLVEMYVLDPEFSDKYYNHQIEKVKQSVPAENLEATLQKIAEEKELFSSPLAAFFLMFLTVFVIGFIITVISSLILRRK